MAITLIIRGASGQPDSDNHEALPDGNFDAGSLKSAARGLHPCLRLAGTATQQIRGASGQPES